MPKYFIPEEILKQSRYNIIEAKYEDSTKYEDDQNAITKKYFKILSEYPLTPERRQELEESYAILSNPETRDAYDESLYQESLKGVELLSAEEITKFNQLLAIILPAVAPDKVDLQLNSVGGGRYAIGDLLSSENDSARMLREGYDLKILDKKERGKFWHLFSIMALAYDGKLLPPLHPKISYDDKVLGQHIEQDLLSAKGVRALLANVQSNKKTTESNKKTTEVLQQIADNFRQVDQVATNFTLSNGRSLGYDAEYGILNSLDLDLDNKKSVSEEKEKGLVTLRFNRNSRYNQDSKGKLASWLQTEANSITENHMLSPESLTAFYKRNVEEHAMRNQRKTYAQAVVDYLYRAIASGSEDEVVYGIKELEIRGFDLSSLNKNHARTSPILFALQQGAEDSMLEYLIEKTRPDFQEKYQRLNEDMAKFIRDRIPLCVANPFVDKLKELSLQYPEEYKAEKSVIETAKFLRKCGALKQQQIGALNDFTFRNLSPEEKKAPPKQEVLPAQPAAALPADEDALQIELQRVRKQIDENKEERYKDPKPESSLHPRGSGKQVVKRVKFQDLN